MNPQPSYAVKGYQYAEARILPPKNAKSQMLASSKQAWNADQRGERLATHIDIGGTTKLLRRM
jgi:hypothetical protein